MRNVVPFHHWHYAWLLEIGEPSDYGSLTLDPATCKFLEGQNSWTGVVDGVPVGIVGTFQNWPGRHTAWALLTPATGPHMMWITRETRKRIAAVSGRIELTVKRDFDLGHRWAKILGFRIENPPGILTAFGPNGEDHVSYVRIN